MEGVLCLLCLPMCSDGHLSQTQFGNEDPEGLRGMGCWPDVDREFSCILTLCRVGSPTVFRGGCRRDIKRAGISSKVQNEG